MNHSAKCVPLSRLNIREATNRLREIFDIDGNSSFPIVELLEALACSGDIDFEIKSDKEMNGIYAKATTTRKHIEISESTYDGACNEDGRSRFTIAHEIGHILLHTPDKISFTRSEDSNIKNYEKPEWQANTFAAELLVPVDSIKKELSPGEIAAIYKVSMTVASIQSKYVR